MHLRQAKGLEPMLEASRNGLPVDIAKVRPLPCTLPVAPATMGPRMYWSSLSCRDTGPGGQQLKGDSCFLMSHLGQAGLYHRCLRSPGPSHGFAFHVLGSCPSPQDPNGSLTR